MAHQAQGAARPRLAPLITPTSTGTRLLDSPEFQELTSRRRSFVVPVLAFVFVWYFGFIALAGYAPDFMGERLVEGFTVGYALALSQFVMTWVLGWLYLRKADTVFDPLAEKAAERALEPRERRCEPSRHGTATHDPGRRAAAHGDPLTGARRCAHEPVRPIAEVNVEAVSIFARRRRDHPRDHLLGLEANHGTRPRSGPPAAASPGVQNGFAIAGDYMSAASFLGIAGLIFLFGFDGFLYSVGFLVAFLIVLFLLAERMRNAGKFTIADVLSFRLNERPARVAAALGTLVVAAFYLIAQMVGAGALIQALVGIDFNVAVGADRRLHAHLRRLRRHARDDLGADHQGRAADDARRSCCRCSCSARSAGTRSTSSTGAEAQSDDGAAYLAAGPAVHQPDRHDLARARAPARHRRACRTS